MFTDRSGNKNLRGNECDMSAKKSYRYLVVPPICTASLLVQTGCVRIFGHFSQCGAHHDEEHRVNR
jgi:hypothetical protein